MTTNHEEIVTDQQIDPSQHAELISDLKGVGSKHKSKGASGESAFSMVSTPGNGKRITFSPNLISKLGSPSKVQLLSTTMGLLLDPNFLRMTHSSH